jgi:cell division septum initiation protein DivIVA
MQTIRYGGKDDKGWNKFKCEYGGPSGQWATALALAEYLEEKEHRIILAAGKPEDGNHRFRFYIDKHGTVFIQAKDRYDRNSEPEIHADPGPDGDQKKANLEKTLGIEPKQEDAEAKGPPEPPAIPAKESDKPEDVQDEEAGKGEGKGGGAADAAGDAEDEGPQPTKKGNKSKKAAREENIVLEAQVQAQQIILEAQTKAEQMLEAAKKKEEEARTACESMLEQAKAKSKRLEEATKAVAESSKAKDKPASSSRGDSKKITKDVKRGPAKKSAASSSKKRRKETTSEYSEYSDYGSSSTEKPKKKAAKKTSTKGPSSKRAESPAGDPRK